MKFRHQQWQNELSEMGLNTFEDWWQLDAESAENPNIRAGKPDVWSKVCKLKTPAGKTVYLKRQQDFYPNNYLQRLTKQLTFEREYTNYLRVKNAGVPVYDLIFFESRRYDGHRQAVYVAEGLDGFSSLQQLIPIWMEQGWPTRKERYRLLQALVDTLLILHQNKILHNALSPRHLFFNVTPDKPYTFPESIQFRLIDFERLKTIKPNSDKAVTRDLFTLYRRGEGWPSRDGVWFLKQYLGMRRLDSQGKSIIHSFMRRAEKKNAAK